MQNAATEMVVKKEHPRLKLLGVGRWLLLVMASSACAPASDEPAEPQTSVQSRALEDGVVCAETAAPIPVQLSVVSTWPKTLANGSATLKLDIANLYPDAGTVTIYADSVSEVGMTRSTAGSTNVSGSSSKFLNVTASALGLITAQTNFPVSLQLTAAIDYSQASGRSDTQSIAVQLFYHRNGTGWLVYDEALRHSTYHGLTAQGQADRADALAAAEQMDIDLGGAEVGAAFVQKISSSANHVPADEAPPGD